MRRYILAVVGLAVVLAACGGGDGSRATTTTRRSTTTSTSTSLVPATTTTAPVATTTHSVVSTTAPAGTNACASRALTGSVSEIQAPAPGGYSYAACSSGARTLSVAVGAGSAGNERTIGWTASFGSVTALNAYGASVTQASAVVRPQGVSATLQCNWDNPLVVYPAQLTMNSSWRTDGRCDMDFRQSLQFNRFSRITGVRSFSVSGQAVRVVLIEETTDLLYVDNPRRNSTSWHSESTIFFDPSHGVIVYEKRVAEATGQYPEAKNTREVYLTSFTPA